MKTSSQKLKQVFLFVLYAKLTDWSRSNLWTSEVCFFTIEVLGAKGYELDKTFMVAFWRPWFLGYCAVS